MIFEKPIKLPGKPRIKEILCEKTVLKGGYVHIHNRRYRHKVLENHIGKTVLVWIDESKRRLRVLNDQSNFICEAMQL